MKVPFGLTVRHTMAADSTFSNGPYNSGSVKQRQTNQTMTPAPAPALQGSPPGALRCFTLPRVVCCSAQPSRQPPREPGASRTRPGAAQPLPPAPLKCVGVPPSKGWSGGAPCAASRAAFARQNRAARSAATSRLSVCLPRSARRQVGSSAPRADHAGCFRLAPVQPSRPPPIACAVAGAFKLRAARQEREPRQRSRLRPRALSRLALHSLQPSVSSAARQAQN